MVSLGKGVGQIASIDPLALKELLSKNERLAKQLSELQRKVNSYAPVGGIVFVNSTNRVVMEVSASKGAFRIDAWVDTTENWFLQNVLLSSSRPTVQINYGTARARIEAIAKKAWRGRRGVSMTGSFGTVFLPTPSTAKARIETRF